ncbi:MAG: hypothetical protein E7476_03450 [Ruminococcaceae bacterium]|nr:hypothetical protein [Oscillospiraceae bacterium]
MHNFRLIKMERYNHSMKFLNFYMFFLLPLCTLYAVISFTWRATVPSAGFHSSADFIMSLLAMYLAIAAVMTIWDVNLLAFITNILFIVELTVFKLLGIFAPAFIGGDTGVEDVVATMGSGAALDPSMMSRALDMTQPRVGLLTKIIQKFAGQGADITEFERYLKFEIILVIGLFMIFYFVRHAKFFLTPVDKFKRVYGFDDDDDEDEFGL